MWQKFICETIFICSEFEHTLHISNLLTNWCAWNFYAVEIGSSQGLLSATGAGFIADKRHDHWCKCPGAIADGLIKLTCHGVQLLIIQ